MELTANTYKTIDIINIIQKIFKKELNIDCTFIYVSGPGSSPSKVYMFKDIDGKLYATKICDKNIARVSLLKEIENFRILYPYLKDHLPKILYYGIYQNYEILITESKGIDNFYTSLVSNKKPLEIYLNIWEDIVINLFEMWKKTKTYHYNKDANPRNNQKRIERIEKGIYELAYNNYKLNEIKNYPIIINGIEYFSLNEAMSLIKNVGDPSFGVTCHGDPQPSNVIIDDQNNWYLVDWEWSGTNHDFRIMVSHLYGWWATRMLNVTLLPVFEVYNKKVLIKYNVQEDNTIKNFQKIVYELLNKNFDISSSDTIDINKFLALLYLGDIRFLTIWEREYFLPVLLGEAIKTLNYCKNKDKKVDDHFTFIQGGLNG